MASLSRPYLWPLARLVRHNDAKEIPGYITPEGYITFYPSRGNSMPRSRHDLCAPARSFVLTISQCESFMNPSCLEEFEEARTEASEHGIRQALED